MRHSCVRPRNFGGVNGGAGKGKGKSLERSRPLTEEQKQDMKTHWFSLSL
jgi:hypothetical protein